MPPVPPVPIDRHAPLRREVLRIMPADARAAQRTTTAYVIALVIAVGALASSLVLPLGVLGLIGYAGVLGSVVARVIVVPLRAALAAYTSRGGRRARPLGELTSLVDANAACAPAVRRSQLRGSRRLTGVLDQEH